MKPARREAYFSCLEITVEHSVNFIELLCRAVFGPYGRYTNLTTMWNSGLTYGANFDFKTGGYLKVGNLVVVALSLNIKSDIAETSYVDAVFDLPLPIVEAALAIWTFNTAAANLNKCRIMPYNNGGLVYVYGALSKGEELQISGAYISAK